MTPTRLLNQYVLVTRRTAVGMDEYGNPTTGTTTLGPYMGYAWLLSANERTADANLQTQEWKLVVDAGAADQIKGADQVSVNSALYEVIGPPWTVSNPRTGMVSHVEVALRRTDG